MRLHRAVLAVALLVPAFVGWPVAAAPQPAPHPVEPEIRTLSLDGVDDDAQRKLRRSDAPAGKRLAAREDLRILTTTRPTQKFELVGVTWARGQEPADLGVHVRTRTSGGGWSAWEQLAIDPDERPDDTTNLRGATAPYWTGDSDGVQVAVTAPEASLPSELEVVLVDPGESTADAAATSPPPAGAAAAATPMPEYVSREAWGADESLRHGDPDYGETIVAGFVHHTVTAPDYTPEESPGIIRSIYAYHTSNGWDDIGYNFLVDQYGQIFEGRYGGVDRPVIGGHTGGMNTNTFGVAALGNFEEHDPTPLLVDAIEKVAAYKLDKYGRDPRGTVDYVAPDGTTTTIDVLSGHRDVSATLCPGETLYAKMPGIRRGTADRAANDATPPTSTTGDFDHDGYADLVLRSPGEGIGSRTDAGSITIVPGSSGGAETANATALSQRTTGVEGVPEVGDRFGRATATGDFDGDTYDDLAVAVPNEVLGSNAGVETGHGAVHVFYGSDPGLSPDRGAQWLTIRQTGVTPDDGDVFGYALAAGDADDDGTDELAVGVPGGGPDDGGAVVVYAGGAGGLDTGSPRLLHNGSGLPADAVTSGDRPDRVGHAVAMGDTDGDGTADLVVGAPKADHANTDSGAVFVVPGGSAGLDTLNVTTFSQDTPGVPGASERADHFGGSLALGQFDASFGLDLAVGASGERIAGIARVGVVDILYSSADGLTGSGADAWHQGTAGIPGANETGDRFGSPVLAAGDFDGDAVDDLAVAVRGEDIGGAVNTGATTVIPGSVEGLSSSGIRSWHQETAGIPGAGESGDRMASSLTAVDLDTDGRAELAVGVPGENRKTGWAILLPGGGTGLTSASSRGISQSTPGVPGVGERGDLFGS